MPRPLNARLAWAAWAIAALASFGGGVLVGSALAQTRLDHITDLTLRTAAAFAVVWPVVLLDRMTTPAQWATRQWLGDSAAVAVAEGVRASYLWLVAGLCAPIGIAVNTDGMPWHGPVAGCVALAMVGVWLATVHALVGGLRAMGQGRRVPEALSGGGTFGPADAAQLIYAPAQGFVVGMVPVAVLTAWWGARGLTVPVPTFALVGLLAVAAWGLAQVWLRTAGPALFAGLRAVHLAHATRFATAQLLPALPGWLLWVDRVGPAGRWLGLAFSRHFPLSPVVLAAVAAAIAVVGHAWPVDLAVAAGAVAYLGATRRLALRELDAWATAGWIGARQGEMARAERRTGLTLAAIGAVCGLAGLVASREPVQGLLAGLLGAAVGGVVGVTATLRLTEVPRWVGWTRAAAWVVCGLALGPGSA